MAGSAGVALVRGSFATWQAQGNLSHMLRGMRASFDEAAAARPAIMVIDEIDAVGNRANPDPQINSYRAQVINGFLEALDKGAGSMTHRLSAMRHKHSRVQSSITAKIRNFREAPKLSDTKSKDQRTLQHRQATLVARQPDTEQARRALEQFGGSAPRALAPDGEPEYPIQPADSRYE